MWKCKWYSHAEHVNGISRLRVCGGLSSISTLDTSAGPLVYVCGGLSGITTLDTSAGPLVYVGGGASGTATLDKHTCASCGTEPSPESLLKKRRTSTRRPAMDAYSSFTVGVKK